MDPTVSQSVKQYPISHYTWPHHWQIFPGPCITRLAPSRANCQHLLALWRDQHARAQNCRTSSFEASSPNSTARWGAGCMKTAVLCRCVALLSWGVKNARLARKKRRSSHRLWTFLATKGGGEGCWKIATEQQDWESWSLWENPGCIRACIPCREIAHFILEPHAAQQLKKSLLCVGKSCRYLEAIDYFFQLAIVSLIVLWNDGLFELQFAACFEQS